MKLIDIVNNMLDMSLIFGVHQGTVTKWKVPDHSSSIYIPNLLVDPVVVIVGGKQVIFATNQENLETFYVFQVVLWRGF